MRMGFGPPQSRLSTAVLIFGASLLAGIPVRPASAVEARGSVSGSVSDAATGEDLPGANIVVLGTGQGAVTDLNGQYRVLGLNPGKYTLKATLIGYTPQTKTVNIHPWSMITLDFSLKTALLDIGVSVEVVGDRPMIESGATATTRGVSSKEMENMGTTNVQAVLEKQAGVTGEHAELHIRGGRTSETLMLLDGMPIKDPLSGSAFGMYVNTSAIKRVEAMTGGFDAEYGEAMSGVVNVEIKEGGEKYQGEIAGSSDPFGNGELSLDENSEFSLSGPEPISKYLLHLPGRLSFFLSANAHHSDTYLPSRGGLYSWTVGSGRFSASPENRLSWLGKLSWELSSRKKLTASFSKSLEIDQGYFLGRSDYPFAYGYPYRYEYYLDHYLTFTREGNQQTLVWKHLLSERTEYGLRLGRFFTNFHADVKGKMWYEYEPLDDLEPPPDSTNPGDLPGDGFFWDTGDAPYWHDHYVEKYSLKADLTRTLSQSQTVKSGLLATYSSIQWIDIQYPWLYDPDGLGLLHDIYHAYTNSGGVYVQDQIKFQGMIANLGLRYDYWIPGQIVDDGVARALRDPELPDPVRREFNSFTRGSFSLFGHRAKGHASPRLGVSYPVTDRDKIFFSYGHFSQLPDYKYVYSKLGERATATYQLFGNPNLNPTVTVAYELGLEHLLTSDMILGVVAYYKDIFDYPTALQVITGPKPEDHFWMYFNSDYARSFGLEFILKKRPTRFFSASLNLTLSQAKGKSSTAEDYWLGQQTLKEWFLEWDRPYKAYASVGFTVPGGQHPVLWGLRLPDDWNASLSSSFESGRRYTPVDQDGNRGETNSGLGPYRFSLDLNVRKNISLGSRFKYYAYLRGTNLTNRRNVYLVNPRTGQAFEPGDPRPPGVSAIKMLDPSRYREPRAVELGVGTRW